jgi:serine protease Do
MKRSTALALALLVAAPLTASAKDSGYLGVRLQRIDEGLAEALDLEPDSGVLVRQVEEDSPAQKAGLEPGDIVLRVDDKAVGQPSELSRRVRDLEPGDEVKLDIRRDGEAKTIAVTLGEAEMRRGHRWPDIRVEELKLGKDHGFLGVMTQPLEGELGAYFGAENGGALVSEVVEDSPAAKLGLKAGDVITRIDDEEIADPGDLRRVVGEHDEEVEVEVAWLRDKKEQTGKATLEVREGLAFGLPHFGHHDMRWLDDGPGRRVVVERFDDDGLREELEELRQELQELKDQIEQQ